MVTNVFSLRLSFEYLSYSGKKESTVVREGCAKRWKGKTKTDKTNKQKKTPNFSPPFSCWNLAWTSSELTSTSCWCPSWSLSSFLLREVDLNGSKIQTLTYILFAFCFSRAFSSAWPILHHFIFVSVLPYYWQTQMELIVTQAVRNNFLSIFKLLVHWCQCLLLDSVSGSLRECCFFHSKLSKISHCMVLQPMPVGGR